MEEAEAVATQSLASCSCEPMKRSTLLLEENKKQVLLGKTAKWFSLLPPVKIVMAIMAGTDTVAAEQDLVAVVMPEEMEAQMVLMVGLVGPAAVLEGRVQDLMWER